MKIRQAAGLLVAGLLTIASQSWAIPQVTSTSGTLFQGDTLQVNGTGFKGAQGAFGAVIVSDKPTFATNQVQTVATWSDTLIKVLYASSNYDTVVSNFYVVVRDSLQIQSNPFGLSKWHLTVDAPDSVGTGDTLTVAYKAYGTGPWVASWFKTYYDSIAMRPFRYVPPDTFSCKAEFDDVFSGAGPYVSLVDTTTFADADLWLMREGLVAKWDTVTIGSVQFLADSATALAPIFASPTESVKHPLEAGGRNISCMDCPWSMYQTNSEAVVVWRDNSYLTPSTASWVVVQDSVEITGAAYDDCDGNWAGHPPKEGGLVSPAGTYCAPYAVVIAAEDSTIAVGDSLALQIYVYADSVTDFQGFLEYSTWCGNDTTFANIFADSTIASSGWDNHFITLDYDVVEWPRCSDYWPASTAPARQKLLWFRFWSSDGLPKSHAGLLATLKFTASDNCQDTKSFSFPCLPVESAWIENNKGFLTFENGNDPPNRGTTYIYEQTNAPQVKKFIYYQGLGQYEYGSP